MAEVNAVALELAEIKGMLTRALSDTDRRLTVHDGIHAAHALRFTAQGELLAEHGTRLDTLDGRTTGAGGRVATVIALGVSALGLIFTIASRVAWA